jgi:hypothetical protein
MPGTVTSSFLLVVAMAGAGAAAEAPPTAGAPSATAAAATPALTGEGWHFLIAPYMWGVNTDFTNLEVAKGGAFAVPLPPGSSTSGDLDLRMQFLEA